MKARAGSPLVALLLLLAILLARRAAAVVGINLTANSNLGFGQAVATVTPGAVTVSPEGVRTVSGGVVLGNGFGASAASFTVTGEPNVNYSITLPSSGVLTGAGSSMSVDEFTSSPDGSGNLGPGGTQVVTLGATLHVGAPQLSAAYSGTYFVTVSYN